MTRDGQRYQGREVVPMVTPQQIGAPGTPVDFGIPDAFQDPRALPTPAVSPTPSAEQRYESAADLMQGAQTLERLEQAIIMHLRRHDGNGNHNARSFFPMNRVVLDCLLHRPIVLPLVVIMDTVPIAFVSFSCAYIFLSTESDLPHNKVYQLRLVENFTRCGLVINFLVSVLSSLFWTSLYAESWSHPITRKYDLRLVSSLVCFVFYRFLMCMSFFYAQEWAFGRCTLDACLIVFVVNCAQRLLLLFYAHHCQIQWHIIVSLLLGVYCIVFITQEHPGATMTITGPHTAVVWIFGYLSICGQSVILGIHPCEFFPTVWAAIQQHRTSSCLYLVSEFTKGCHVVFLFAEIMLNQHDHLLLEPSVLTEFFLSFVREVVVCVPALQVWIGLSASTLAIVAGVELAFGKFPEDHSELEGSTRSEHAVDIEGYLRKPRFELGAPVRRFVRFPCVFVRGSRFVVSPISSSGGKTQIPYEEPVMDNSNVDAMSAISEEERNAPTCVVCMECPRTIVLEPCMHFAVCDHCAEQMVNVKPTCPLCRETFKFVTSVQRPGPDSTVQDFVEEGFDASRLLVVQQTRSVVSTM